MYTVIITRKKDGAEVRRFENVESHAMYSMNEWFCTVFPNDPDEMPQDFESYAEAKEYGDKVFGKGNYILESPC